MNLFAKNLIKKVIEEVILLKVRNFLVTVELRKSLKVLIIIQVLHIFKVFRANLRLGLL